MARPTKYESRFCAIAESFMGEQGKSITQLAREIGVVKSTLYQWAKDHEEFSNALQVGREHSQAFWEDELEQMMYNKDINSPLVKLYFANRFKWHDKPEQEKENQSTDVQVVIIKDD